MWIFCLHLGPQDADFGTVTAIAEDPNNGTLYVLGLTMPRFSKTASFTVGQPPQPIPIFTKPTLATIPVGEPGPVTATELICNSLALPISLAFVGAGAPAPCPGDVNGDLTVDLTDLGILLINFGTTPADPSEGDVNDDDIIDLTDLGILLINFGTTCP